MTLPVPESWLVVAIAYYPALVLAVVWHEAGHLIGARLVGGLEATRKAVRHRLLAIHSR